MCQALCVGDPVAHKPRCVDGAALTSRSAAVYGISDLVGHRPLAVHHLPQACRALRSKSVGAQPAGER